VIARFWVFIQRGDDGIVVEGRPPTPAALVSGLLALIGRLAKDDAGGGRPESPPPR